MSQGEPWVWLFSDDDLMSPDCVGAFLRVLQKDRAAAMSYSVYRFNTAIINTEDRIQKVNPPHPAFEGVCFFSHITA